MEDVVKILKESEVDSKAARYKYVEVDIEFSAVVKVSKLDR